jgi:hypothetical protein
MLYLIEEGVEGIEIPNSLMEKSTMLGPLSQVFRAVKNARRVTKSDNSIVVRNDETKKKLQYNLHLGQNKVCVKL